MNQQRIRFRQLDFKLDEFQDELGEWSIARKGCGPTSVAIVLANYGYKVTPVDIARIILTDEKENLYVINPNAVGDKQIAVPFTYTDIVREMYGRRDRINFLFVKKERKRVNDYEL